MAHGFLLSWTMPSLEGAASCLPLTMGTWIMLTCRVTQSRQELPMLAGKLADAMDRQAQEGYHQVARLPGPCLCGAVPSRYLHW